MEDLQEMVLDCNPRFSSEKVPTAELVTSVSLLKNFPWLGQPDEVIDLILISVYIAPFLRTEDSIGIILIVQEELSKARELNNQVLLF